MDFEWKFEEALQKNTMFCENLKKLYAKTRFLVEIRGSSKREHQKKKKKSRQKKKKNKSKKNRPSKFNCPEAGESAKLRANDLPDRPVVLAFSAVVNP